MKDSRISFQASTPVSISTATTTNSSSVDLWDGVVPVSGTYYGTNPYCGVGAQIYLEDVGGTSPSFAFKWQVSSDNSTWVDDKSIGTLTDDGELRTTLRTTKRYARIACTSTGTSPAGDLSIWAEDFTSLYGESIV